MSGEVAGTRYQLKLNKRLQYIYINNYVVIVLLLSNFIMNNSNKFRPLFMLGKKKVY